MRTKEQRIILTLGLLAEEFIDLAQSDPRFMVIALGLEEQLKEVRKLREPSTKVVE